MHCCDPTVLFICGMQLFHTRDVWRILGGWWLQLGLQWCNKWFNRDHGPPTESTNQWKEMTEAFNHCLLGSFFRGEGTNQAMSFSLVRLRRLSRDFCTLPCWLQGRRSYVALAGLVWSPRSHRHPRDAETDRYKQNAQPSLLKIRPQIHKYNIFRDLQMQSVNTSSW